MWFCYYRLKDVECGILKSTYVSKIIMSWVGIKVNPFVIFSWFYLNLIKKLYNSYKLTKLEKIFLNTKDLYYLV